MSDVITIRGRAIVKVTTKAAAIVTKEPISFLGGVDPRTEYEMCSLIRVENFTERRAIPSPFENMRLLASLSMIGKAYQAFGIAC